MYISQYNKREAVARHVRAITNDADRFARFEEGGGVCEEFSYIILKSFNIHKNLVNFNLFCLCLYVYQNSDVNPACLKISSAFSAVLP